MNKLYSTNSIQIQNWLEQNGIYPVKEVGKTAHYPQSPQLSSLLDYFMIEHCYMTRRG